MHVVDNYKVKTNLICNESLFQQTDMDKKKDSFNVKTGEFPTSGIFFYIKQIRHNKSIDYACEFI